MLKSCQYCNRIHDSKYICPQKQKVINARQSKYKSNREIDKFRNSTAWRKKREEIKSRDLCLCAICKDNKRYVYDGLSCHHIEPLTERFDLRLENNNLITLCSRHHEDAESGKLSKKYLHDLINKSN